MFVEIIPVPSACALSGAQFFYYANKETRFLETLDLETVCKPYNGASGVH